MRPDEIACRHQSPDGWTCGAEAGEWCNWSGMPIGFDYHEFHSERQEDAMAMTSPSDEIEAVPFDDAAERTGLL